MTRILLTIHRVSRLDSDRTIRFAVCAGLLVSATAGCRDDAASTGPAGHDSQAVKANGDKGLDAVPQESQPFSLPDVELEGIDDAVATVIRDAMDSVRVSRRSAKDWGHLGMVLLAHDLRAPAAECFGHAHALEPNDPRWPLFHARAIQVSDPLNAIPLMEKALSLFPESPKQPEEVVLHLQLAELLIERNLLDKASQHIQEVLALDADNARAHYELGRLAFLNDDFTGCLQNIQRAETLGATRKQGALLAAEAHRRLGDNQAANEQRARATGMSKSPWPDPFAHHLAKLRTGLKGRLSRAEYLYAQNKVDESIALLTKTIADYPESHWARILLARALIRLRRLSEAEDTLAEALELSPDSVEAHYRMGVTLQLRQKYREALNWFEQALRFKPDFAMAHRNVGFCQMNLGDLDAAAASLRRAVESQPDFLGGWKLLGQVEEKRGNIEQARHAYEKALTLEPEDRDIQERLRLLEIDATVDPSDLELGQTRWHGNRYFRPRLGVRELFAQRHRAIV